MQREITRILVFRLLFSDKNMLLLLYNAINGTDYTDPEVLTITTLENAVYMTVKNDVSCMVDMKLDLYEHRSTINPNVPLRDLDYISDTFAKFYSDRDIYSSKLIRLPNPRFFVFYNGELTQPAIKKLRLSDAFEYRDEEPSLELVVTQININSGYNDELMSKCSVLKEYMTYVDLVRRYQKSMSLDEAVNLAVDECIEEGILAEFLMKNRAEVVRMSIYEYDEKLHEKTLREEGREEGIIGALIILRKLGHTDAQIIPQLIETYNLSEDEAIRYVKSVNRL